MPNPKKQKFKQEKPETSHSNQGLKDRDLSAYIDDRVEMLQQVFSAMKPKEIIAIAPKHIKHLPVHSIQELCLEELLGISSKRLSSILDGAEPPSDTESSSASPNISDALSLDSISSDEGALSPKQSSEKSNKKSKKCKRRDSRKQKSKEKAGKSDGIQQDKTAERAGLTVLELLELQARARAIRAQLQVEQTKKGAVTETVSKPIESESDDDIQIKEEPAQVVELISSDDEKPNVEELNKKITADQPQEASTTATVDENKQTVTKRNELTIIVPTPQVKRKIKLNRQKSTAQSVDPTSAITANAVIQKSVATTDIQVPVVIESKHKEVLKPQDDKSKQIKNKAKTKKQRRKTRDDNEGSENDGLILQLSDSEKMDLEDFDSQNINAKADITDSEESSEVESDVTSRDSTADSINSNCSEQKQAVAANKLEESTGSLIPVHEKTNTVEENTVSQSDETQKTESLDGSVLDSITSNVTSVETTTDADTNDVTESTTVTNETQEKLKDLCDSSTKIELPVVKLTDTDKPVSEDEDILSLTGNEESLKQNYSDVCVAEEKKKLSQQKKKNKKKEKKAKKDKKRT